MSVFAFDKVGRVAVPGLDRDRRRLALNIRKRREQVEASEGQADSFSPDDRISLQESTSSLQVQFDNLVGFLGQNPLLTGRIVEVDYDLISDLTIEHKLGREYVGVIPLDGIKITLLKDSEQVNKSSHVQLRVQPWYEFYYTKLTAAAQDILVDNLKGDTDLEYRFNMRLIRGATATYTAEPNSLTSDQDSNALTSASTTVAGTARATLHIATTGSSASTEIMADFWFKAVSGNIRLYNCIAGRMRPDTGGSDAVTFHSAGGWTPTDATTKVTDINFHSSVASGFAIGTQITGEKFHPGHDKLRLLVF